MAKSSNELQYTAQVKSLVTAIYGKQGSNEPSIYAQAKSYFESQPSVHAEFVELKKKLAVLKAKPDQGLNAKEKKSLLHKIAAAEQELAKFKQQLMEQKLTRHRFLELIAEEILSLAEGDSFDETNRKSAKLLGTIQLSIDTESQQVVSEHERSKPLYKAVLCLRLLDRLFLDGGLNSNFIVSRLKGISREDYLTFAEIAPQQHHDFMEQVKLAVVVAAILQDIGNFHPQAQQVLYGEDGFADPHRTLEPQDRKKLLLINHTETLNYVVSGLGVGKYVGDSKVDRDLYDKTEKEKLIFINHLLKSWINPEQGIGNLLKVPQIYTSIVLSTKPNYDYKLIPQVYQVLSQNVEKGFCNKSVVRSLQKITGMFPQGFGVTYVPKDSDGHDLDRFEYAIVNHLYPKHFKCPMCRSATRNLTFIARGNDVLVGEKNNLYFPDTVKSLTKISKQRLNEILASLASNYQERQKLDVLPRCWHAKDFFSVASHQNLWNKVGAD
jgi:hypothetical protein